MLQERHNAPEESHNAPEESQDGCAELAQLSVFEAGGKNMRQFTLIWLKVRWEVAVGSVCRGIC
jgi:hypothetical protein